MENENIKGTENYFTKEVQDSIAAMGDKQMTSLLLELEGTDMWVAILKYTQQRLRMMESTILYADPVKEPTLIARSQGIMLGLSDLQNAVITIKNSGADNESAN